MKSGKHEIRMDMNIPRAFYNGQVDDVLRNMDIVRATIKDLTDELASHIADPMAVIAEYEVLVSPVGNTAIEVSVSVPMMGRNDD